jgi:hypothetical protein
MIHPQLVSVGILVLGLAILAPGSMGQAAPLPPPKKMSLPAEVRTLIATNKRAADSLIARFTERNDEACLISNVRYDYYADMIYWIQQYINGGPRWKPEQPLTIEERRGLRDLLYRLQREMAEGQANGTVGHEKLSQAWRKHRDAQKKKK